MLPVFANLGLLDIVVIIDLRPYLEAASDPMAW
jgi:hypothetical protein